MRIDSYKAPKSSFLSVEKDLSSIVDLMFRNERLKKLLYYTSDDCLTKPTLTEEQTYELIKNNIKLVPKLLIDKNVLNYIILSCDNFIPSENPEFRDNIIEVDIICHFDQWQLKDFKLRPYQIAAEIDTMLDGQRFSGIGILNFVGAVQTILTDEFAGICIKYTATHSGDDKVNPLDPRDIKELKDNFNKIFNN